jgi:TPR repeat protein
MAFKIILIISAAAATVSLTTLAHTTAAAQSIQELEAKCMKNDANACFIAAGKYEDDASSEQNKIRSAELYTTACDFGHAWACSNLGLLYNKGHGVQKDHGKAKALFQKACDSGLGAGCFNLGEMYENGTGVTRDIRAAEQLYKKSCDAKFILGCEYFKKSEAEVVCFKIGQTRNMDNLVRTNLIESFGIKDAKQLALTQMIIESEFRLGNGKDCVRWLLSGWKSEQIQSSRQP